MPQLLKFVFLTLGFALQTFHGLGVSRGANGTDDPLSGLALFIAARFDEGDGFGVLPGTFVDANEHGA